MNRSGDARLSALKALGEVLDQGANLGEVRAFDHLEDERDRAFARRLAYGVLRWKSALEWLRDQLLQRPLKARERDVRRLLLIGLYQLWLEDTADHAAVHATAETARRLRKAWAVGLVNAVLRRFQRERDALLERLMQQPERWAHPAWLTEDLQRDWPDQWEAILAANNEAAPLWLRNNQRQGSRREGGELLAQAGFTTRNHPLAPDALAVSPAVPVDQLPDFETGRFSVQDAAAQLAAVLIDPREGERILDACAAPGGKTGHLLEWAPGCHLTALDQSAARLERVAQNLERLGLEARLQTADAADPDAWWDGQRFQKILLDAPCTATGVIRRHPEIKWLRSRDQVGAAVELQGRLLRRLWPLLEPGGILVYATCSVLRRENDGQIHAFLEQHPDAEAIDPAGIVRGGDAGRQFFPGEEDMDGFYYAVLRRPGA